MTGICDLCKNEKIVHKSRKSGQLICDSCRIKNHRSFRKNREVVVYVEGRLCRRCAKTLSIYNPHDTCWSCPGSVKAAIGK